MGKTAQLRSTLDLVWFERTVRDGERVTTRCADARSLGISTVRLVKLCGAPPDSASADRETTVATRAAVFERQLRFDPERYRYRATGELNFSWHVLPARNRTGRGPGSWFTRRVHSRRIC
jgi:hypothetical protein